MKGGDERRCCNALRQRRERIGSVHSARWQRSVRRRKHSCRTLTMRTPHQTEMKRCATLLSPLSPLPSLRPRAHLLQVLKRLLAKLFDVDPHQAWHLLHVSPGLVAVAAPHKALLRAGVQRRHLRPRHRVCRNASETPAFIRHGIGRDARPCFPRPAPPPLCWLRTTPSTPVPLKVFSSVSSSFVMNSSQSCATHTHPASIQ